MRRVFSIGAAAAAITLAVAAPALGSTVEPLDSGPHTNQQVILEVGGVGLHVDEISAGYTCDTDSNFRGSEWVFINNVVVYKGPSESWTCEDTAWYWKVNKSYPNGTQICVELHSTVSGIGNKPGHPCINVHP